MGHFKKALFGATFIAVAAAASMPAQAVTITSTAAFPLLSLGTGNGAGFQSSGSGINANGTTVVSTGSNTGVYSGTGTGYTSPFGAGSNLDYYAAEPGGSITFTFASAQTSFGLLFGTIDTFNQLTFTTTGASGTQMETGADVASQTGITANGRTTAYILFSGLGSFNTLTVSSSTAAFEFVPAAVPEPISIALLGTSLVGLGLARRRSAK